MRCFLLGFLLTTTAGVLASGPKPNIVLILTDDLGYGDVSFLNPSSRIVTPSMDALAKEGVYFTDAHAPSSICTPTRYSILSGKYAWRNPATASGVLMPWEESVFSASDKPIALVLQEAGYATACIGKWHLGFDWPWKEGYSRKNARKGAHSIATCAMFDFSKPITGGPLACGFNYYFGDDVPNFPPYAFIENERFTCEPVDMKGNDFTSIGVKGGVHGDGPGEAGWQLDQVLPTITEKAEAFIEKMSQKKPPFFLFFTPTSPHTPVVPVKEFQGRSQAGYYGDFVVQTDDSIGRIVQALKKNNCFENTLLIVTSDNGPSPLVQEVIKDHDHRLTGPFRGMKHDIWEGGHRVPFVVSWPQRNIVGGKRIDDLLVLTDLYATMAAAAQLKLDDVYDGVDQTTTMIGKGPSRSELVSHSNEKLALRQDEWVLLVGGGGMKEPGWRRQLFGIESPDAEIQLFNLKEDLGQRLNVADRYPERVEKMITRLDAIKKRGK